MNVLRTVTAFGLGFGALLAMPGPSSVATGGSGTVVPAVANLHGVAKFYFARATSATAAPRVWSVDADGSHLRAIGPQRSSAPNLTADGRRLVYQVFATDDVFGPSHLVVANANGTRPHVITSRSANELAYNASWSPDGKQLLYGRGPGGPSTGIYRINADGSHPRMVSHTEEGTEPSWFPNGRRFAYIVGSYTCCRGYTIGLDGRGKVPIGGSDVHRRPDVSPDGRQVVFQGQGPGATQTKFVGELFVQTVSTGRIRALPATIGCTTGPNWSPDGTVIFFTRCQRDSTGKARFGSKTIMSIASDGSGPVRQVMPLRTDIAWLTVQPAPPTKTPPPGASATPTSGPSSGPSPTPSGSSATSTTDASHKSTSRGVPIAIAAVLLALVAAATAVQYRRFRSI